MGCDGTATVITRRVELATGNQASLAREHTDVASDDDFMNSGDIQKMLAQAQAGLPKAGGAQPKAPAPPSAADNNLIDTNELEALLNAGAAPKADSNLLNPNDIEALFSGAGAASPPPTPSKPKPTADKKPSKRAEQMLDRVESGIEAMLREDRSGRSNVSQNATGAKPFELAEFPDSGSSSQRAYHLGTLDDVELDLHIELGRAELLIDEVLSLKEGAVVPLDKMAGDPVDIVVNGRLIARGEVLVLNDNFCVRVAEIVTPDF